VADARQFGSSKVLQFGDKMAGNQSGDSGHCAQCEAMLADAIDGTLSAEDQQLFDAHMAECGPCSQLLADARRGAAWLEMLRTPAPEPPAALLERILAQTSGGATQMIQVGMQPGAALAQPDGSVPAMAPGYARPGAAYGNVIPFRQRFRASSFGQIVLQPRLAMTAAMAFFSIALTMNLTGVHPTQLRASDLSPGSLNRDFTNAKASVVRHYEGLRVVYELESRVHDLQSATANDPAAGSPSATPTDSPNPQASPAQPEGATPADQPGQKQRKPASGPTSRSAPNSGSSRRDGPGRPLSGRAGILLAASESTKSSGNSINWNGNSINSNGNSRRVEGSLV
jgi:hypothetical protein